MHSLSTVISMLIDLRDYRSESIKSKYTRLAFLAEYKEGQLQGDIYFFDDLDNPGLYKSEKEISYVKAIKESECFDDVKQQTVDLCEYYKNSEYKIWAKTT